MFDGEETGTTEETTFEIEDTIHNITKIEITTETARMIKFR